MKTTGDKPIPSPASDCPECGDWKPVDEQFCRVCRVGVDRWKLTRAQLEWLGPEGNPARRELLLRLARGSSR